MKLKRWLYALGAALLLTLGGVALAQNGDGGEGGGLGYLFLVSSIAGAVAAVRQTPWGKRIDGPFQVGVLAVLIGLPLGPLFITLGLIDWTGEHALLQSLLPWPWNAALLGAACGIAAVFNVSIFAYLAKVIRREGGLNTAGLLELARAQLPGTDTSPTGFVWKAATLLLNRTPTGAALTAIGPLLGEYAQHPAILTDDLRAEIQRRVLEALRRAGLVGVDLE